MNRPPANESRLHRSRSERMLFGVCGGLAEYFELDPTLIRVGWVLATLFPPISAIGIFGYLLLAVIVPEAGTDHITGRDRLRHNLDGLRTDVSGLADSVRARVTGEPRIVRPTSVSSTTPAPMADPMSIEQPNMSGEGAHVPPARAAASDESARQHGTVH